MTAPVVVYTYNFISDQTFGFPDRVGTMLVFPFPVENGTSELDQYWTGRASGRRSVHGSGSGDHSGGRSDTAAECGNDRSFREHPCFDLGSPGIPVVG